ncbi:helicase sen1-like [Cystoisospora suis]|uniref:Helicase sen1-like n=1 Tax=Cystoisospora suis TaxID=483139 RepID=A0A2C6KVU1_9APIC|nr:helicase sen1-like [Cystoisospora suis]
MMVTHEAVQKVRDRAERGRPYGKDRAHKKKESRGSPAGESDRPAPEWDNPAAESDSPAAESPAGRRNLQKTSFPASDQECGDRSLFATAAESRASEDQACPRVRWEVTVDEEEYLKATLGGADYLDPDLDKSHQLAPLPVDRDDFEGLYTASIPHFMAEAKCEVAAALEEVGTVPHCAATAVGVTKEAHCYQLRCSWRTSSEYMSPSEYHFSEQDDDDTDCRMEEGVVLLITESRMQGQNINARKLGREDVVIGVLDCLSWTKLELAGLPSGAAQNRDVPENQPGPEAPLEVVLELSIYSNVREVDRGGSVRECICCEAWDVASSPLSSGGALSASMTGRRTGISNSSNGLCSSMAERGQGTYLCATKGITEPAEIPPLDKWTRVLEASTAEPALLSRVESRLQRGERPTLFLYKVGSIKQPLNILQALSATGHTNGASFVNEIITGEMMSEHRTGHAIVNEPNSLGNVEVPEDFVKRASERQFHLDPSQLQAAVSCITEKAAKSVHLLVGPPGTGKTHTVTCMLACLTVHRQRTLCCASSNQAVGEMARRTVGALINQDYIRDPFRFYEENRQKVESLHTLLSGLRSSGWSWKKRQMSSM